MAVTWTGDNLHEFKGRFPWPVLRIGQRLWIGNKVLEVGDSAAVRGKALGVQPCGVEWETVSDPMERTGEPMDSPAHVAL